MSAPFHTRLIARSVAVLTGLALAGCTPDAAPPVPTDTESGLSPTSAASSPSSTSSRVLTEPTTTNTLPPPPRPTGPAPSTAGGLSASSLPIPSGWRTAVLPGGDEEGFQRNGTWVHARDPRYAAQDVIALGCISVTRDDYTDPSAALEGNYQNQSGDRGIGLVLEFPDEQTAIKYFDLYKRQVEACTRRDQPVRTALVSGVGGLVDRRTYPDSEWTEIAERNGNRITLIILTDPGHSITKPSAQRILDQIRS
jgi:hypothetical protein